MFKYTPLYANGKDPIIEQQDVYRIEIPYVPILLPTVDESGKKSTLKDIVEIFLFPLYDNPTNCRSAGAKCQSIAKYIKNLQDEGIKHIGPNKGGHWEVIEWQSSFKWLLW